MFVSDDFTPGLSAGGGALLGLSVFLYLHLTGRPTGLSGIFAGLVTGDRSTFGWKVMWIGGLLATSAALSLGFPEYYENDTGFHDVSWPAYLVGGLLVGFGTRYGNGCTSGHGICGLARASPRSIVATFSFLIAGLLVSTVLKVNSWLRTDSPAIPYTPYSTISYAVIGLSAAAMIVILIVKRGSIPELLASLGGGTLFGVGFMVSGMARQSKILNFLALTEGWDPSLLFVLGTAVAVAIPAFLLARSPKRKPWIPGAKFAIPSNRIITFRLAIGAFLFGIGWGFTGFCPGPGLALAAAGYVAPLAIFVPSMAVGMWAVRIMDKIKARRSASEGKQPRHEADFVGMVVSGKSHQYESEEKRVAALVGHAVEAASTVTGTNHAAAILAQLLHDNTFRRNLSSPAESLFLQLLQEVHHPEEESAAKDTSNASGNAKSEASPEARASPRKKASHFSEPLLEIDADGSHMHIHVGNQDIDVELEGEDDCTVVDFAQDNLRVVPLDHSGGVKPNEEDATMEDHQGRWVMY